MSKDKVRLTKGSRKIIHNFGDCKHEVSGWDIEEFCEHLDGIKAVIRDAANDELQNPRVNIHIDNGYYGEQHIVIEVVGDRPMTELELRREKDLKDMKRRNDKLLFEELSKRFGKKKK